MGILQEATPEAVKLARRPFPEARREDFLVEGRDWTDKATGPRYRVARYDPLQSLDPKQSNVSMFVVSDSKLVFLQRQGAEDNVQRVELGMVGARTVTGRERLGVAGGTEIY